MRRLFATVLASVLLLSAGARAAETHDLISFGYGYMNFDKSDERRQASDYRIEYRSGIAWQVSEQVGFHPAAVFEFTGHGMDFTGAGWAMDYDFLDHWLFTWSEDVGYLQHGNMHTMGGVLQFRSMGEVGYRFDNGIRLTAEASHISDANLTKINPGAEIVGGYVHVPIVDIIGAVTP
jgi:hypothetical protein